jgi:endoglucanase
MLRGVIISTPPHLRKPGDDKLPPVDELMVDVGLGYELDELKELIPIGTPVGFPPIYSELLGGKIAGKSFDDKACGAIAAYAVANTPKEALACDVCVMFSRYEETSRLGGVTAGVFGLKPDYAMVIDVNLASVPDVSKRETVDMDKGVSITLSAGTNRRLTRETIELCREKEIPYTLSVSPSFTGTNASSVNLVGEGVAVVDIGLPLKSMHTYNEVISLEDCETLARLVEEFVSSQKLAEIFAVKEEIIK